MATTREVKLVLDVAAKGGGSSVANLIKTTGEKGITGNKNLQALGIGLGNVYDQIGKLNEAMHPEIIQAAVAAEIKLAEARQKLAAATKAEMERQAPTVKAAGKNWFSKISEGMGGGAGIVQAVSGGGIGGLAKGGMAAAGPWGQAASAVIDSLKSMASAAMDYARAASPVEAGRLDKAYADLSAVIGRVFVPVLELATTGVRLLGDTLTTILPSTSEMRVALAPIKDAFVDFRNEIAANAPALKVMFTGMVRFTTDLVKVSFFVIEAAFALKRIINSTVGGGKAAGLRSSFGASGGSAHYQGLEDIGKNAAAAMFGAGITGGDASSMMPENIGIIKETVEKIFEWLGASKATAKVAGDFLSPFGAMDSITRAIDMGKKGV